MSNTSLIFFEIYGIFLNCATKPRLGQVSEFLYLKRDGCYIQPFVTFISIYLKKLTLLLMMLLSSK